MKGMWTFLCCFVCSGMVNCKGSEQQTATQDQIAPQFLTARGFELGEHGIYSRKYRSVEEASASIGFSPHDMVMPPNGTGARDLYVVTVRGLGFVVRSEKGLDLQKSNTACTVSICLEQARPKPPIADPRPQYPQMEAGLFDVTVREVKYGKPTLQWYVASLSASNPYPHDICFILPYWGNQLIPSNYASTIKQWLSNQVTYKNYKYTIGAETGECREVVWIGKYRAIFIPPSGHIQTDEFQIETWAPLTNIEVFIATALRVDGGPTFSDWCPFRTFIIPGDIITPQEPWDWQGVHSRWWKPGKSFKERDNLTFTNIVPEIIERHVVTFRSKK